MRLLALPTSIRPGRKGLTKANALDLIVSELEGDSYLTLTPGAGTPDGAGVEPGTQRQEVGVHHLRPEPRARLHQGFNQIKPFLLRC